MIPEPLQSSLGMKGSCFWLEVRSAPPAFPHGGSCRRYRDHPGRRRHQYASAAAAALNRNRRAGLTRTHPTRIRPTRTGPSRTQPTRPTRAKAGTVRLHWPGLHWRQPPGPADRTRIGPDPHCAPSSWWGAGGGAGRRRGAAADHRVRWGNGTDRRRRGGIGLWGVVGGE
jgi:hypothetical protein